jgi:Zn-dependent M28 family amino/carboxypeptidase
MDKSAKTKRVDLEGVSIAFDVKTDKQTVEAHNLVGYLEGSDPELKKEVVVLGAHFDHLGMDARGRMAAGADDNASGSAALLEVAEALSLAKPRRSIVIAGFSGEEDGLLGSRAFCEFPPIEKTSMIAMLNMDMIGRGKDSSVVVLGAEKLRDMEKFLDRGDKLAKTGIKKIVTNKGQELWQRSDHYSFYEAGVPVLFFFEAVPITDNEDYHTWRDTPELVNIEKVTNTARLVYNTAWLIAQDDDRPRME